MQKKISQHAHTRQCRTQFFQTYRIFASMPKHRFWKRCLWTNKFVFLIGTVIHCFIPQLRRRKTTNESPAPLFFFVLSLRCFCVCMQCSLYSFSYKFLLSKVVYESSKIRCGQKTHCRRNTQTGMLSSRYVYYMEKPHPFVSLCWLHVGTNAHSSSLLSSYSGWFEPKNEKQQKNKQKFLIEMDAFLLQQCF